MPFWALFSRLNPLGNPFVSDYVKPKKYQTMNELMELEEPIYYIKKPTFWEGIASLHDLYNSQETMIEFTYDYDNAAMRSDFDLVAKALWAAFEKFEHDNLDLIKSKSEG